MAKIKMGGGNQNKKNLLNLFSLYMIITCVLAIVLGILMFVLHFSLMSRLTGGRTYIGCERYLQKRGPPLKAKFIYKLTTTR